MTVSDYQPLIDALLPKAIAGLRENREFMPFAGTLSADGYMEIVAPDVPDSDQAQDIMKNLVRTLREKAGDGGVQASCIIADVRVDREGQGEKIRAVLADIETPDAYAELIFIPYRILENRDVEFGDSFPGDSEPKIFTS